MDTKWFQYLSCVFTYASCLVVHWPTKHRAVFSTLKKSLHKQNELLSDSEGSLRSDASSGWGWHHLASITKLDFGPESHAISHDVEHLHHIYQHSHLFRSHWSSLSQTFIRRFPQRRSCTFHLRSQICVGTVAPRSGQGGTLSDDTDV